MKAVRFAISILNLVVAVIITASATAFAGDLRKTMETDHFLIHFAEGYFDAAKSAAKIAEEVYPVVTARLKHEPGSKTHILLSDISDNMNGSANVIERDVIRLYCVPPQGIAYKSGLSSSVTDWYEQIITHEFAHIVQMDMAYGLYRGIRKVFGNVPYISAPNLLSTAACKEGYATYEETLLNNGRGATTLFDMYLRGFTLTGRFPTLDKTLGAYDLGEWWPGGGTYLWGYSLFEYMADRFGDQAVSRYQSKHAELGFIGMDAALELGVGVKTDTLYKGWKEATIGRYKLQQADIESRGLTAMADLNSHGSMALYPKYSPDGTKLAYQTSGGGFGSAIWVNDRVMAEGACNNFDWTPDSRTIIYSTDSVVSGRLISDLYAVDISTGKDYRITTDLRAVSPSVSPDGSKIAYIALDGSKLASRLVVADLIKGRTGRYSLGNPEVWAEGSPPEYIAYADWMPKGDRLIVTRVEGSGRTGIYLMSSSDSQPKQLICDSILTYTPAPSPDGRYLVYESDATGVSNIYAYELISGRNFQITNVLGGVFCPALSPDGRTMVLSNYTADGFKLSKLAFDREAWRNPYPAFEGKQWERASWREKAVTNGATPVAYDLSKAKICDYSPVSTLFPTWWIPDVLSAADRVIAINTGNIDITGRNSYDIVAGYDLKTNAPKLDLSYSYTKDSEWGSGFFSDLELGVLGAEVNGRLTAGYNILSGNYYKPVKNTLYSSIDTHKVASIGWSRNMTRGASNTVTTLSSGIRVTSDITNGELTGVTASSGVHTGVRLGTAFTASATVGADTGSITLSVRGLRQDEGLILRSSATPLSTAELRLGCEIPVWKVNRGLRVYPVFLTRTSLNPFIDIGIARDDQNTITAGSAGLTYSADISLVYGEIDIKPYVGGAYVAGTNVKSSQFRLLWGCGF